MNVPFTALIKSKGYRINTLAEEVKMSPDVLSKRVNGYSPWLWREVCPICAALDITLDDFSAYFPAGRVKPGKPHEPTRAERIDSVLAELREILV
uniref:SOS-response transcriptional repressor n=1 Tax=Ackermannviridae sp. TaxID=2831612 RepID=A0A8S5RU74_9CAUD|nr:MAG TPA: SOS-response transcriptional repressor [Ackermannviridae sp.]